MQLVFWISFFLLFYTYLGYGLLLFLFNAIFKRKKISQEDFEPAVTLLIAAYNEEFIIRKKIENSLALDYPADKITYVFITDGSTDNSSSIISQYPQIKVLHEPTRKGKSAAI